MRLTTKGQGSPSRRTSREKLGLLPYVEVEFAIVGDSVRSGEEEGTQDARPDASRGDEARRRSPR